MSRSMQSVVCSPLRCLTTPETLSELMFMVMCLSPSWDIDRHQEGAIRCRGMIPKNRSVGNTIVFM
jgi:hypothetical protein